MNTSGAVCLAQDNMQAVRPGIKPPMFRRGDNVAVRDFISSHPAHMKKEIVSPSWGKIIKHRARETWWKLPSCYGHWTHPHIDCCELGLENTSSWSQIFFFCHPKFLSQSMIIGWASILCLSLMLTSLTWKPFVFDEVRETMSTRSPSTTSTTTIIRTSLVMVTTMTWRAPSCTADARGALVRPSLLSGCITILFDITWLTAWHTQSQNALKIVCIWNITSNISVPRRWNISLYTNFKQSQQLVVF